VQNATNLLEKISNKEAIVGILGLGQVGLPTALCVLNSGYKVIGLDINENLVKLIGQGKSPLPEAGLEKIIVQNIQSNRFNVSSAISLVSDLDILFICVPTPIDDTTQKADLTYLKNALKSISNYISNKKLIIIESTIPPNTIKNIVVPYLENEARLKLGNDFLISYCPERLSPGNTIEEFANNDRIVGSDDSESLILSSEFMKRITRGTIHITHDTTVAEISKLAENAFRDLNIAFANELAIICENYRTDVMDVIQMANTHPRVNIHKPGPGVGGPCLPKDPYLLINGFTPNSLISIARKTNDSMHKHIILILLQLLSVSKIKNQLNILILGASYKPGVDDTRYSPTQLIVSGLKKEGFENISVHDQYSKQTFGTKPLGGELFSELKKYNCIITVTAHPIYYQIKSSFLQNGSIVIDAARIFDKNNFSGNNIVLYSLGSKKP
jgi:UDP-N-acetyl-D-mannosaminuronic acid dehydrogenase